MSLVCVPWSDQRLLDLEPNRRDRFSSRGPAQKFFFFLLMYKSEYFMTLNISPVGNRICCCLVVLLRKNTKDAWLVFKFMAAAYGQVLFFLKIQVRIWPQSGAPSLSVYSLITYRQRRSGRCRRRAVEPPFAGSGPRDEVIIKS